MRRSIALVVFLFVAGCGFGPNPDTAAAEKFVRSSYSNVEIERLETEGPEYATVSKIPDSHRVKPADRPAACGVRVRFTWRDGNRTTHDDWVVWVTSDHQAIDRSGNGSGDNWRQLVRSAAKN
jgi:hypothetical protein